MAGALKGKRVAIVVTDGFEQVEMTEPKRALDDAGAETKIIAPKAGKVSGWKHTEWGDDFDVDLELKSARPEDFDALVLPGGVMSPDKLRVLPEMQRFVRAFFDGGKPVAAICHGPWSLIDAGVAKGRRVTSWPTLKTDLTNAGAEWEDAEVLVDGNLVTSRKPDDLPAFDKAIVDLFAKAPARQAAQRVEKETKISHPQRSPER